MKPWTSIAIMALALSCATETTRQAMQVENSEIERSADVQTSDALERYDTAPEVVEVVEAVDVAPDLYEADAAPEITDLADGDNEDCAPDCDGKLCGPDDCGGLCGHRCVRCLGVDDE